MTCFVHTLSFTCQPVILILLTYHILPSSFLFFSLYTNRLAQHNWDATPLIVDLSGEGKELQNNPALQAEIVNKFNALRNNSAEVSVIYFCYQFDCCLWYELFCCD